MSVAEAFPCLRQPFFFLFFFTSHGLRVFKANRQTRKEIDRTLAEDKRVLAMIYQSSPRERRVRRKR